MDDVTQSESNKPSAFISERHRNPAELMARSSKTNNTLAGICAICATIIFALVVVVMYLDWAALSAA